LSFVVAGVDFVVVVVADGFCCYCLFLLLGFVDVVVASVLSIFQKFTTTFWLYNNAKFLEGKKIVLVECHRQPFSYSVVVVYEVFTNFIQLPKSVLVQETRTVFC